MKRNFRLTLRCFSTTLLFLAKVLISSLSWQKWYFPSYELYSFKAQLKDDQNEQDLVPSQLSPSPKMLCTRLGPCPKKYFLQREIFPATGNIFSSRIFFLVICRWPISLWDIHMDCMNEFCRFIRNGKQSYFLLSYTTSSSSFIFLVIIPCYIQSSV